MLLRSSPAVIGTVQNLAQLHCFTATSEAPAEATHQQQTAWTNSMDSTGGSADPSYNCPFDSYGVEVDRPQPTVLAKGKCSLKMFLPTPSCHCLLQMSAWTAGVVVLTLLINAPLIPMVLKWTGLSQVSPVKAKIRAKAARAFTRYTENAVKELQNDQDEMLRGEKRPTGQQFDLEWSSCTQAALDRHTCDADEGPLHNGWPTITSSMMYSLV